MSSFIELICFLYLRYEMALINLNTQDVYYREVSLVMETLMGQKGSHLLPYFMKYPINGASEEIIQMDVDSPRWMEASGAPIVYSGKKYGKRFLNLNKFYIAESLGEFETFKTRTNPAQVASLLWDKVGIFIDDIILHGKDGVNGIVGNALAKSNAVDPIGNTIALPDSQYLFYDNTSWGYSTEIQEANDYIKYGLSTSKLLSARSKLMTAGASSNLGVIGCSNSYTSLMADTRYSNLLWNVQPAAVTGQMTPFNGLQFLPPSERVTKRVPSKKNPDITVDHVYVVDLEKIYIGVPANGSELNMNFDQRPDLQDRPLTININGVYDCTRMQEEAVIVIEVKSVL
jgi:hypothetical protein